MNALGANFKTDKLQTQIWSLVFGIWSFVSSFIILSSSLKGETTMARQEAQSKLLYYPTQLEMVQIIATWLKAGDGLMR